MKIELANDIGQVKKCKVGFCWTGLFFGIFVPLLRGDWIGLLIMLIVDIITFSIAWLVWPFMYNRKYINRMLEKGYYPSNKRDYDILAAKRFIVPNVNQYSPKS